MKNRGNIMIVGDSLSAQFTVALMNAIKRDRRNESCDIPFRSFHGKYDISCDINTDLPFTFRILNHRNDRLSLTKFYLNNEVANFHEMPWYEYKQIINDLHLHPVYTYISL